MIRRRSGRGPMRLFTRYWLPLVLYVGLIAFLSSQPYLHAPVEFKESDKLYHLLEYVLLGLLIARALRASASRANRVTLALIAICMGIVIGTGDEFLQSFIPGRHSSALDLLVDTIGVSLAQFVHRFLARE